MDQPSFQTSRLVLRPRGQRDLGACYAMNMEPGTIRYIAFPREGSWDDERAHRSFLDETLVHEYPDGLGYWTVTLRGDPEFLGWVLMAPEDLTGPNIELGWRFRAACRGKGYATEAARALLRHGFGTLGLSHMVADINPGNIASRRVAAKLGMRPPDGEHEVWRLDRRDWVQANG